MQKKDLISNVAELLRKNDVRKPVSIPKQTFHISDDEGNHKDFTVKKTDKSVLYSVNDVKTIIDACLTVIEESLKRGEEICISGFGTLGLHWRAARRTKHPKNGEEVNIRARYVPKFSFGGRLRMAARLYELSLAESLAETNTEALASYVQGVDE